MAFEFNELLREDLIELHNKFLIQIVGVRCGRVRCFSRKISYSYVFSYLDHVDNPSLVAYKREKSNMAVRSSNQSL